MLCSSPEGSLQHTAQVEEEGEGGVRSCCSLSESDSFPLQLKMLPENFTFCSSVYILSKTYATEAL